MDQAERVPNDNLKNTSTTQISRNSKAGASRQEHECPACGLLDHKIRHCDKKRNIYVKNNNGIITKEIIKEALNNEQTYKP